MKPVIYDPQASEVRLFVKCLANFEEYLVAELKEITGKDALAATRGAYVSASQEEMYAVCYRSRLAQKVLVPLASFGASSPDELYEKSLELPWADWMNVDDTYAIHATVHSAEFEHSQFAMQRLRDGLNDSFRESHDERPSVDTEEPKRAFHLHIDRDRVNLSLDATGLPLHKRGYRKHGAGAPLSEVLAASIIAATEWKGDKAFYDMMCGSGTLAIEAGMRAAKIPAQYCRPNFAFQEWPWHDEKMWNEIKAKANAEIDTTNLPLILASDLVPNNVKISQSNAEDLPLADVITWKTEDLLDFKPQGEEGLIVLNPPYGGRIGSALQVISLYGKIGTALKHNWGGHEAWIISSNNDATKRIGLKPSKKMQVFNGALECKLMKFELFKGKRASFLEEKKKG